MMNPLRISAVNGSHAQTMIKLRLIICERKALNGALMDLRAETIPAVDEEPGPKRPVWSAARCAWRRLAGRLMFHLSRIRAWWASFLTKGHTSFSHLTNRGFSELQLAVFDP